MVLGESPDIWRNQSMAFDRLTHGDSSRSRHRVPLPLERQLEQPGLVVRSESLLITSVAKRRRLGRDDWAVIDALQEACDRHADTMPAFAWIYASESRRPVEITSPDPSWLARWRNDHVTVGIE